MSSFPVIAVIICTTLLTVNGLPDLTTTTTVTSDAPKAVDFKLYEHFAKDSRYIQYSETDPTKWTNLTDLTDDNNFTYRSMICTSGPGAWLLYPEPNYELGQRQVYFFVIGENCVRIDDISSVQPIGKRDEPTQGVLLFSKPNFASTPTYIKEEGSSDVQSLIFTGSGNISLSWEDVTYCITPERNMGYCVISDLTDLGKKGPATIKNSCPDDIKEENRLKVNNCYIDGVHEIYDKTQAIINPVESNA